MKREKQLARLRYYKERLELTYKDISERSGVPESTVKKVLTGATRNPRPKTFYEIEEALGIKHVLEEISAESPNLKMQYGYAGTDGTSALDTIDYERANNGEMTLDDYYALPDDRRVELIDGVFYDMASPTSIHQMIIGSLFRQIGNYIDKNKGKCVPFVSPMDVQLDRDNKTMLEPDLFVVCDRDKITEYFIFGAPDLIIEVVSPSSKINDYVLKLWKYRNSGVREYWIIDYKKDLVRTYFFDEDDIDSVDHTFKDDIPVRIYGGKLTLNLDGIVSYLGEAPQ
ncbi:MAG: Uma2 family endonuclease [Lachnospiraceae bacterium]|nr:Uma2 family endonuclease [Lachnospiraceae bacterium]